jgi:hypothetical protein
MEPVRIKYYGLFWLSRQTYVVLQSIVLFLCVAFVAIGFLAVLLTGSLLPHRPPVLADVLLGMFWIGLVAFPLEAIEMVVMLRKFARAESEHRARLAAFDAGAPAPPVPSSTAVQTASDEQPNTNIQP